ncbi:MAG TPA: serine/threonine-protein kinase [Polyangiaceae bacterium]|nr:serine/threonine-protein kinase [Polyangiaceae bacterium]
MQCEACGHSNLEGARFCANCGALMPTGEKSADPLIGQTIGGRFRVTGVLGEGGMGVVYVGEQHMGSNIRKVAIKTLHPHLSKDPSVLARFNRECGTVSQLEHPNTIKVYDFGSTADGTLYIAMEFVAGRPLADVIRDEGSLSPERVVRIMRQVCGALDEAHDKGIVHRDLKPENVILTSRRGETDVVKVLDFGIAARTESADAQREQKLTQQGMVLGTPPYMSPEQFTGKALDARSDIYSLGVMTYEMLTGRLPFDAETPWEWATQHMTAQPKPFEVAALDKNIPSAMKHAVLKSLAKERDQRQSSARDFFSELSDGGHVTLDAPPPVSPAVSAHASTGTAAMDALPHFNAPPPVVAPARPITPHGVATPVTAPGRGRGSSGGKGLVIGLVTLGGVLLVAIAVVFIRSRPTNDDVTTVPIDTGPVVGTTNPPPAPTAAPPPTANTEPTAVAEQTPTAQPTTVTSNPPKQTTSTGSGASTAKQTGGGGGCDACSAAVASGNFGAAAAAVRSCSDTTKQEACKRALFGKARAAAVAAAKNGDCGTAEKIVRAGESAGLPSGLNGALSKCGR